MTSSLSEHSRALLARAQADPARPAFHFTAPAGWLNDPNGLAQIGDTFHLFYQHNPQAPVHDAIVWGHATSTDLVSWTHQPIALRPEPGPDEDGCWSGVLVDDAGTATLVYSGHAPRRASTQTGCLATGAPDAMTWTKDPDNPVIPAPPSGVKVTELRDHSVWRTPTGWQQVMGAGLVGRGGGLLLFESADLRTWEYRGVFLEADQLPTGGVYTGRTWECPDVFAFPDAPGAPARTVLVFSAWDRGRTLHPVYVIGRHCDGRFVPDAPARHLDYGLRHFYAPQSFTARDGRRIQFGWSQEARPDRDIARAGWSGVMSMPRVLTLRPDGSLHAAPVTEVDALRTGEPERATITSGSSRWLDVRGNQLDIRADVRLTPGGHIEIAVLSTVDGTEATTIVVERPTTTSDGVLVLDRSRSRSPELADDYDQRQLAGLVLITDDHLPVRILVDHSIVEVFAAGRPLTARVYPTRGDADRVFVAATGPAGTAASVSVWQMRGAGA